MNIYIYISEGENYLARYVIRCERILVHGGADSHGQMEFYLKLATKPLLQASVQNGS